MENEREILREQLMLIFDQKEDVDTVLSTIIDMQNIELNNCGYIPFILKDFSEFLKENDFLIQKKHPQHKPGQGYSPGPFIEYDIDKVVNDYIKENDI
jgi:hypothetical protein